MKRTAIPALLLALALAGAAAGPAAAQEGRKAPAAPEPFSFYGLRFGMSAEEVRSIVATNEQGTEVVKPGHGMMLLTLAYDFKGRLAEIRAAYQRPETPLRDEALLRAINDRFVQPVSAKYREISVSIDQYSNRAAATLVFLALDQRQEALEHYRAEYLKLLD